MGSGYSTYRGSSSYRSSSSYGGGSSSGGGGDETPSSGEYVGSNGDGRWLIRGAGGNTFYVFLDGDNKNRNHYHVGSDGTVLSVKRDKKYAYNRRAEREKINAVLGFDLPTKWTE